MASALLKKIEKMEAQLANMKLAVSDCKGGTCKTASTPKPRARKDKPSAIEKCAKKSELDKFTKKELTEWIKKKQIALKGISEKYKDELVNFVWKNLKKASQSAEESESDCDDESGSDYDSGDESD